jgi:hypothetical protein
MGTGKKALTFKAKLIDIPQELSKYSGRLTIVTRVKPRVRARSNEVKKPARNFGAGRGSAQIIGDLISPSKLF